MMYTPLDGQAWSTKRKYRSPPISAPPALPLTPVTNPPPWAVVDANVASTCAAIFYDFDNLHYRADSFFVSGNANPLTTLYNFTSIWQNETLSMITYADSRSLQPASCIQLNLGIGMMMPGWMMQGSCMGDGEFLE